MASQGFSYLLFPGSETFLAGKAIKKCSYYLNNIGASHQRRYGTYQMAPISKRLDSEAKLSQRLFTSSQGLFFSGAKLHSYGLEQALDFNCLL